MSKTNKRIAVVTDGRLSLLGAGDWMQARRTAEELIRLAPGSQHFLLDAEREVLKEHSCGKDLPLAGLSEYDIVHLLPCTRAHGLAHRIRMNMRPNGLLVGSTVSWESLTHHIVSWKNGATFTNSILKHMARRISPRCLKSTLLTPYNLLLPNSIAEQFILGRYYNIRKETTILAIPNGIDTLNNCNHSSHNIETPRDEYVLYPGVFSARKNQLGFIHACRHYLRRVVFMGGPLAGNRSSIDYYNMCTHMAPRNWDFLGAVAHNSQLFQSLHSRASAACLASSCETPGISLLEAASYNTRSAVTSEGCAIEYFGPASEYLSPLSARSIRQAVKRVIERGPLTNEERSTVVLKTWTEVAEQTLKAYDKEATNWSLESLH